jgi:hypothetical protein
LLEIAVALKTNSPIDRFASFEGRLIEVSQYPCMVDL